jgi:glucose-1-phosphate thymidylyltransferase
MKKAIILAGGSASRLRPATTVITKQLLPVYDKPLIYYPITTAILSGSEEILIISAPEHRHAFEALLGDGSRWGIGISYVVQERPAGLAEAILLGQKFIGSTGVQLLLGDNLFHGANLGRNLAGAFSGEGAMVSTYQVADPKPFGVVSFDDLGNVTHLEEKPELPRSNWVVPGIYFYDNTCVERAKTLRPSSRGELEITDLNLSYLNDTQLKVLKLDRGTTWFDMGTPDSLLDAAEYVRVIQKRQGLLVGSPEEAAWRMGLISEMDVVDIAKSYKSDYGRRLEELVWKWK